MNPRLYNLMAENIIVRKIRKNADNYYLLKEIYPDQAVDILNKKNINLTNEMIWDLWEYSQNILYDDNLEKWCEEHNSLIKDYVNKESFYKYILRKHYISLIFIIVSFCSTIILILTERISYNIGSIIFVGLLSLLVTLIITYFLMWARFNFKYFHAK